MLICYFCKGTKTYHSIHKCTACHLNTCNACSSPYRSPRICVKCVDQCQYYKTKEIDFLKKYFIINELNNYVYPVIIDIVYEYYK